MTTPWSRQKALQRKYSYEEVPSIEELDRIASNIHPRCVTYPEFYTARARALFVLLYLTGARGSEIVKCPYLMRRAKRQEGVYEWAEEHEYEGVRKSDIKQGLVDDLPCLFVRIENRKHRLRRTKRQPIPILLEKDLVRHLYHYLNLLDKDEILFPFQIKRATQIINETINWNLHFLRHIRATHLVVKYDFNEQLLVKYMGWTDSRPAKHYMELSTKDMFRQFHRGHNDADA